ncbi:hypothetical protein FDECE_10771 [Fusarium decemcellulare]|nr:hypothetical protein FDECE_10771 [Fusarium decemcellulare]
MNKDGPIVNVSANISFSALLCILHAVHTPTPSSLISKTIMPGIDLAIRLSALQASNSIDLNKIIRSAYGTQIEYEELSIEAIELWNRWNADLANGEVPPAGSVGVWRIPNTSRLSKQLSPETFLTWMYSMMHGAKGGLYGFLLDSKGHLV